MKRNEWGNDFPSFKRKRNDMVNDFPSFKKKGID
jgi:hypothetical protein